MYDIFTIGAIKLDTFIVIPKAAVNCKLRMPACELCIDYGKKIPVQEIDVQIAGSAPNVAIGVARMNRSAAVYSQMGDDILHSLTDEFLKKNKVDTKYIKANKNMKTSFAAVLNFKGESTQLVKHDGVEFHLPGSMPKIEWMHISELGEGYHKLYREIIKLKKQKWFSISFNPGTVQIQEKKKELFELLKFTNILFVNRVEAVNLLGLKEDTEIHNLMSGLKNLGPPFVVMTDGQNGAYAYDGIQLDYAPMFPGERVEATGAGDAFTTGFLGAMINKKRHAEALMWGSVNAASVVHEVGPTIGLLKHTEIKRRLKARPSYKTKEL